MTSPSSNNFYKKVLLGKIVQFPELKDVLCCFVYAFEYTGNWHDDGETYYCYSIYEIKTNKKISRYFSVWEIDCLFNKTRRDYKIISE